MSVDGTQTAKSQSQSQLTPQVTQSTSVTASITTGSVSAGYASPPPSTFFNMAMVGVTATIVTSP